MEDPTDPFNNGARSQSFTPALNETWDYSNTEIRGVNLGGWLVLEPFISSSLFSTSITEEWVLVNSLRQKGELSYASSYLFPKTERGVGRSKIIIRHSLHEMTS